MFRHQLGALTLLAAFALPLAASAQTAPGPQPAAPAMTAPGAFQPHSLHNRRRHRNPYLRALHRLSLSDAQKQQIAGYLHGARAAARQARIADARALRAQIDAVLTPDQRNQLRTAMARSHRAPGGPAGPGGQPAQ